MPKENMIHDMHTELFLTPDLETMRTCVAPGPTKIASTFACVGPQLHTTRPRMMHIIVWCMNLEACDVSC